MFYIFYEVVKVTSNLIARHKKLNGAPERRGGGSDFFESSVLILELP